MESTMDSTMDSTISLPSSATSKRAGFLDLPEEIQKEIIGRCSQADWICLALVSRHIRELAASHLYRNFHIVFPDDDDPSFDIPIDGLASGLNTFATSEYDYAKHLRDISLDTFSTGSRAESAYKSYLSSLSCGKFLNTLFLLPLLRAKSLDTFKWNIRVELSRPVYKALHNIKSLRHLCIRLQAGPSLYEPPPPLPNSGAASAASSLPHDSPTTQADSLHLLETVPVIEVPAPFPVPVPTFTPSLFGNSAPTPKPPPPKPRKRSMVTKEPPTLSGFKELETLSILDIDDLDIITELKSCVRNSASTLRKLKLSFSDALATQARKPNLEVEPEDSDQEDEFHILPVTVQTYNDGSGPAKTFRAQQERKAQEAVLGRIFEVEPFVVSEQNPIITKNDATAGKEQSNNTAGQAFIDAVSEACRRMWANWEGSSEFDSVSQQDVMNQIITAAKLYVESKEPQNQETPSSDATVPASVSPDLGTAESVPPKASDKQHGSSGKTLPTSGLFGNHENVENSETKPEDIDVEAPEEQWGVEGQDEPNVDAPSDETTSGELPVGSRKVSTLVGTSADDNISIQMENIRRLTVNFDQFAKDADQITKEMQQLSLTDENADVRMEEANARINHINTSIASMKDQMKVVASEIRDAGSQDKATSDHKEDLQRRVTEYARGTRGISLESLAIHLIPTKARVLSKAVNLRTLKKLTLLNVGPQASIWTIMVNENKQEPLPLRKVFTDNVCPSFLNLVSQLESVEEVLMLERGPRYKPESFAPKTSVKIEQIRRAILRRHMENIKVLMIKNEADTSWDVDDKTMRLICGRGRNLKELVMSTGIRTMHTLLQHLTGFSNLFALHIHSFRNDDLCLSVMREMRRFIVDTLSYHPKMKLEWIAIGEDCRAQRIVRHKKTTTTTASSSSASGSASAKKKKISGKDKWKAPPSDANGNLNNNGSGAANAFPAFPPNGWGPDSSDEEEGDGDGDGPGTVMKLTLSENTPFYDIWGVRVFRKEIVDGRL